MEGNEHLSPRICCSAPIRRPSAIYEQFLKYQKFKQLKKFDHFIKLQREELLKSGKGRTNTQTDVSCAVTADKHNKEEVVECNTDLVELQIDGPSTSKNANRKRKEQSLRTNRDLIDFQADVRNSANRTDNRPIEECVQNNTDLIDLQINETNIPTDLEMRRREQIDKDFENRLMKPLDRNTCLKSDSDFSDLSTDSGSTATNLVKHLREELCKSQKGYIDCNNNARSAVTDHIDWTMDERTSATFIKEDRREDVPMSNTNCTERHSKPASNVTLKDKQGSGKIVKSDAEVTDKYTNACSSATDTDKSNRRDLLEFFEQYGKHEEEESLISSCDSEYLKCKEMRMKAWLKTSHAPVICPITECNRSVGLTSLLSHYLKDHNTDFGIQCEEIFAGITSTLIFDPTAAEMRENICLGVLAYGGFFQSMQSRPAERGICTYNAFLPLQYEHLESHLPILIMATRTTWGAMVVDKELETKFTKDDDVDQHLLVIWLTSVESTTAIHASLTLFDKSMLLSRSTIIKVRSLNQPQDPSVFMTEDTNYMRLGQGEINALLENTENYLKLDIVINEIEGEDKDKCCHK